MHTTNANELKKKEFLQQKEKKRLLLQYEALSEAELICAVAEAEADYKAGNYVTESVDDHIKRVVR